MGCNCQKVTVAGVPEPRTFVVDARGMREVTGMVLPSQTGGLRRYAVEAGRAIVGQLGGDDSSSPLGEAQNRYVVPGLVLGGAGGIALAKTVLAAHPFAAAAIGIGGGLWYALSNLRLSSPGNPSPTEIAASETQGAVLGVALGAGAGLLLEGFIQRYKGRE